MGITIGKKKSTKLLIERQPMIGDFWPRYCKSGQMFIIVMQIALTLVIGLALVVSGIGLDSKAFFIVMFATILTSVLLNLLLFSVLSLPFKDLLTALTHVSGEPINRPMPSPNSRQYMEDGFKPVLQYVYDHAAAEIQVSPNTELAANITNTELLEAAFKKTTSSVVILDSENQIVYFSANAPVIQDTTNTPQLELLFDNTDNLTIWLDSCRENSVHADKTWMRIPNKTVGNEDRRVFNIAAHYEKAAAAEVTLFFFDGTSQYQPEDDSLDFIAFAAHELRGPITVIKGYLDVLDVEVSPSLNADQKRLIERLIVSANRLSGYINNILSTSKYDRRHLRMHLREDTVKEVYAMISDDMALRAQSQNRLLSVELPQNLPTIAADRSSLSEVISNLIDNALKYSNEGGAVYVSAKQQDDRYVAISVQDNGIGMPANVVGNLFHKFYRSHRSRETVAGTGIGLYICKAIVESHGGTINVVSTEGHGSEFTITVPIYATVKDKILADGGTNDGIINTGNGWIKNHAKFMG